MGLKDAENNLDYMYTNIHNSVYTLKSVLNVFFKG